jgi:hypothetical protein
VIYDWRMHGTAQSLASRLPRIGQAYVPPGDDVARKAVVCPAARPAPAAPDTETTTAAPIGEPPQPAAASAQH